MVVILEDIPSTVDISKGYLHKNVHKKPTLLRRLNEKNENDNRPKEYL